MDVSSARHVLHRDSGVGGRRREWEIATEWTYRLRLSPRLVVQPDVQYVHQPGGDPDVKNALVVGGRLIVSF